MAKQTYKELEEKVKQSFANNELLRMENTKLKNRLALIKAQADLTFM